MIKVSVILPVYGVAQYIEKCTQSLLDQTLQEMEFIFVDDHGPDNSIDLVKKMIEDHPRKEQFLFLKPEHNLGAGMARNYAIPQAKGEYIAFVDSDDWVEPNMFEELYEESQRFNGVDLCYCYASKDYQDGHPSEILKNPIIEAGEITHEKRCFFLKNYVSLFWTFIYRRDFIMKHNIRYPEDRSADDSYFVTSCLLLAESSSHVEAPFYHYLIRPGSVCTTKDSNKYQKRLSTFRKLMAFTKEKGVYDEYKDEIDYIYLKKGGVSSVFNYVYNSLEPKSETLGEILAEIDRQIPQYQDNPHFRKNFSLRVLLFFMKKFPRLSFKLISWYSKKKNVVS